MERLEQTGKTHLINGVQIKARKKTTNKWFETQDSINYWDDFSKQKLVWTPVNSEYRFTVLPEEMYFNNSLFMITGKDLCYLCGILNSKLFVFYFNMLLSSGSYAYGSRDFFCGIPILKALNQETKEKMEALVREILVSNQLEYSNLCKKIDNLVYSIYDITDEMQMYIEKNTYL